MDDKLRTEATSAKSIVRESDTNSTPASIRAGNIEDVADGDIALRYVQGHERVTYTPDEEKAVLRKIDRVLMPLMVITYIVQYMDKSVLPQSAVYGLSDSLGLKGQDYSWCTSLFYFGYMGFQPIASIALTYLPPGRVAVAMSVAWSVILICTAGAHNYAGMAICRFVLGCAEGAISPTFTLITGAWYTQAEIPLRITLWFCGNGFAIIIQAFISYGIGHIESSIPVWKWFFIIYGLIALAWSAVLYFYMPSTILDCTFLTDHEKSIAIERIRGNRTGVASNKYKNHQMIEALKDPKVWWSLVYTVLWMIPNTAVGSFGTLVIKGLGFNSFQSSLLNAPLGVTENIGLVLCGWLAYKYKDMRLILQMVVNVPALLGSVLLTYLPAENKAGRLVSFYLVNFNIVALPLLWALCSSNIAGHTKRTTASAFQFIGYSAGSIIGPQFFRGSEAPHYGTALRAMIICFSLTQVMPLIYYAYLTWENKKKTQKEAALGNQTAYVENEEFLDETDMQQVRFRYIK